ncbi:hypothetical protein NHB29_22470 (plasmid) [Pantoea agglomerans]|uniref:hypothetical protein n=1 Tax=Enterobacter agglomerans TaxID=549 RepID=UPI00273A74A9|nr:hypothetical protein [Pantoea agglomerans]WLO87185.1 hypothetical protein NHB29_22470 [Pantoea agglomerans]
MRSYGDTSATSLPVIIAVSFLAVLSSLMLIALTDDWLLDNMSAALRVYEAIHEAPGAGSLRHFMIGAMFLYVLGISVCGIAFAAAIRISVIKVLRLAGR